MSKTITVRFGTNIADAADPIQISDVENICNFWKEKTVRSACLQYFLGSKIDTTVIRDFDKDILSFCKDNEECRMVALSMAKGVITAQKFSELCGHLGKSEQQYCN